VILAHAGRNDWIVCQITSNPVGDQRSFPLKPSDFVTGALGHVSYVRPGKVFTANETLIAYAVGTLSPEMFGTVREAVIAVIEGR